MSILEIYIHIEASLVLKVIKSRGKKLEQKKQSFLAEQNPMI